MSTRRDFRYYFLLLSLMFCASVSWLVADGTDTSPASTPPALPVLMQPEAIPQRQMLLALGRSGPAAASHVPAMQKLLRDKAEPIRHAAAYALARVGTAAETALPEIMAALTDESPRVRREVFRILAIMGPKAAAAVEPIEKSLSTLAPEEAVWARLALLKIGRYPGVQRFHLLKTRGQAPAANMAGAIAMLSAGNDMAPVFADLMASAWEHPNPLARDVYAFIVSGLKPALTVTGDVPEKTPPEVQEMIESLKQPGRLALAVDLGQMGTDARAASAAIQRWQDVPEQQERVWAFHGLARIGYETEKNIRAIAEILRAPAPLARVHAAGALEMMAPLSMPALDNLIAAVDDPDAQVRDFVLAALGQLRSPKAVPTVKRVIAESPAGALLALGRIGAASAPAIDMMKSHLASTNAYVRRAAAYALSSVGKPAESAVRELAALLQPTESPDVRREALKALAAIGPTAGTVSSELESAARTLPPYEAVLAHFALLMADVHPNNHLEYFLKTLAQEDQPDARLAASLALLAVGDKARPVWAAINDAEQQNGCPLVRDVMRIIIDKD